MSNEVKVDFDGFEHRLFAYLLFLLFLGLRLAGIIAWSWWWVFSPLWLLPVALLFIMFTILALAALRDLVRGK